MKPYFDPVQSAAYVYGDDPAAIIRLMAGRFMGANPETPYTWRTWDATGIQSDTKAVYHFDFQARFPQGEPGESAWAGGDLYCPAAKNSHFVVCCYGPVCIWLNGDIVFCSNGSQERTHDACRFGVALNAGFNRFVIRCERTTIGFGCTLANAMPQWEPCNYVLPFLQRGGAAGFLYTAPTRQQPCMDALWGDDEAATGLTWLPGDTPPMTGDAPCWGWAQFELDEARSLRWEGAARILIDGSPADDAPLCAGMHQLMMYGALTALHQVHADHVKLTPPVPVKGICTPFLVLAVDDVMCDPTSLAQLGRLHQGQVWRPAMENLYLRPFAETALYGRWTYPLGVTLYGMISASRLLKDQAMADYVHNHVRQVITIQEYALWEKAHFGFPGVNQQLCWLDALDDCGSFGSLMLECDPDGQQEETRTIAQTIGQYMLCEQMKTPEGAFCRRDDTIWIDDMYMSVPFLCRYAALTNDSAPLDECVRQMLHYRRMQLMPDKQIMAHMRCLRHHEKNDIPWSRGNGWVIFSLSELLLRLPEDHPRRRELLDFFFTLTQGYLALQDKDGLWHQILDEEDTYCESSATAMFICAFARGVRMGWYSDALKARVRTAVRLAWKGLARLTIDRNGNLYGVCQGSGFSFSRAYYRTLGWNFNDTHGTGIVMLAGTEFLLMQRDCSH